MIEDKMLKDEYGRLIELTSDEIDDSLAEEKLQLFKSSDFFFH